MKIHDVSIPISSNMPVYEGDKPVSIEPKVRMARGGPFNISRITMSTHTGTHTDPPFHFIDGAATIDRVPLEPFIGPCWVADTGEAKAIRAKTLDECAIPSGVERLLLKTRNARLSPADPFTSDFASLDSSAAEWCRDRKLLLLGIDYMSVGPYEGPAETHTILLGAGIAIVEWLDLSKIEPGPYKLICLPLLIKDGDGAPARAVLIEE